MAKPEGQAVTMPHDPAYHLAEQKIADALQTNPSPVYHSLRSGTMSPYRGEAKRPSKTQRGKRYSEND